jgi:putative PIN family toxin of toxin-antitoxin system
MVLETPGSVVLDTNIVLDLLVFRDPASLALAQALHERALQWLATPAMRDELERVLAYPQIAPRLAFYRLTPEAVLAGFDSLVRVVAPAPSVPLLRCKDPDDQQFIDLAVAHRALLLSKDLAVLRLAKRLAPLGVRAQKVFS